MITSIEYVLRPVIAITPIPRAAGRGRCLSSQSIRHPPHHPQSIQSHLQTDQPKTQFAYQPLRPKPRPGVLEFLPPSHFKLRIVSISYNRPSVHGLLSPNFPISKCFRYNDPKAHFVLTAVPPQFANLSHPIPPHIRSLNSCFSKEDQERWGLRRIDRRRKASSKPIHELRLTFSLKIKELHKSSLIRKSIRKRWIAALKLIVQYGAQTSHSIPADHQHLNISKPSRSTSQPHPLSQGKNDTIKLDPADSGFDRWLDKDHYYIVHPNLSLNTVGLVELVDSIRSGLQTIKRSIPSSNPRTLKLSSPNTPTMPLRPIKSCDLKSIDKSTRSTTPQLLKSRSVDDKLHIRSSSHPDRIVDRGSDLPHKAQKLSSTSSHARILRPTQQPDRRNDLNRPSSDTNLYHLPPPRKIPFPKK